MCLQIVIYRTVDIYSRILIIQLIQCLRVSNSIDRIDKYIYKTRLNFSFSFVLPQFRFRFVIELIGLSFRFSLTIEILRESF